MLLRRFAVFLLIMDCASLFLYALGTRQSFTEAAQLRLLGTAVLWGLSLVCASVYGMAAAVRHLFRPRKYRLLIGLFSYLLLGVFGALTAVFAAAILVLTGGNG